MLLISLESSTCSRNIISLIIAIVVNALDCNFNVKLLLYHYLFFIVPVVVRLI